MDTAEKNGIYAFLQFNKKSVLKFDYQSVMSKAVKYMNHPALFGWYLFDEPNSKKISPEQLKFFNDMLHKLDPYHPVLTSNWEQGKFKNAIDVDMYQFYQGSPARMYKIINKYPHRVKNEWKTFSWVAILNTHDSSFGQKGAPNNSPCTFYSSIGSDKKMIFKKGSAGYKRAQAKAKKVAANLENPPFPHSACFPKTETVIRGQAFDAIVHGSNGLFWWLWTAENEIHLRWGWYTVFHKKVLRTAIRKLLKDLHTLSPYLIDSSKNSRTRYAGRVFIWQKRFKKGTVIIAVNESVKPAKFKILTYAKKVYVFDSKRIIPSGSFVDKLKANEARVYSTFKVTN
jgi:hypothetical protein